MIDWWSQPVWPVKSGQMSIKVVQNDFKRKMKDCDIFTKIAENVGNLGFKKLPKAQ